MALPVSLTRRRVLTAAAGAAVAGLCPPAIRPASAQEPPLRPGETLPDPDFSQLRAVNPYVVGVRPYRRGGVRLELQDEATDSPQGWKYIIHNYGHGGAGITLSWGCASVVVEHVATATRRLADRGVKPSVAVLGTGVIGLTAATEIRRKYPHLPITVYAKDLDVRHTTSHKAAGQFEPSGIDDDYQDEAKRAQLRDWLRRSRAKVAGLQSSPRRHLYGIAERKNYTLDLASPGFELSTGRAADGACDVLCPPRTGQLPFGRLNGVGREYDTWLINPTILLPRLVADLKAKHVAFRQKHFDVPLDVEVLDQSIIVNCTGYGAKMLFNDEQMQAKRGHLVVLRKTHAKQFYFFSGGCGSAAISYVFCRQNDIVIGGSVRGGDDNEAITASDAAEFTRIIDKAKALFDGDVAKCIALNAQV